MELPSMVTNPPIPASVYRAMAEADKHRELMDANEQQIKLLTEQNEQLIVNFNKLDELYKIKEQELSESKAETKKSQRMNIVMLILTILSMLIAAASWLFPNAGK